MKICQVINSFCAGGAEVFASQLAVALKKKGHDVIFITYQGIKDDKGASLNKYLIENGVDVYHFKFYRKNYFNNIWCFLFILRNIFKHNPDIVHAHLQLSDIFVLYVKKLLSFRNFKIIRTIHNKRKLPGLASFFEEDLFKSYNFNIGCSDFVKENYEDEELRNYIRSIPNGIDLNEVKENQKKNMTDLKKELGLSLDKKVILNIGSMYLSDGKISKKNQTLIIHTLSLLKNRNDFLMVFLGDGNLRGDFEDLALQKGISDKVLFVGKVSNVYDYISVGDIFFMPSLSEGLPIALIEVVCSGVFSITSSIEAFVPFKSDSVWLIDGFDENRYKEKIEQVLDNIDYYKSLAQNNVSYYNSLFNIDNVADKYLKFYHES